MSFQTGPLAKLPQRRLVRKFHINSGRGHCCCAEEVSIGIVVTL